jgi:cobalt-zinc-cadmium efflux system outer membrane protein
VKRAPWLILAAVLCGCAVYRARPIDPAETHARYQARTLSDPGLRAYVDANRPGREPIPQAPLDLTDLTLVAFYYHPDLDVSRARLAAAEAATVTAGARPNPTVSVTPEYALDAPAGLSPWLVTVAIEMPIETAGKRGYRIARARRLTDAASLDVAETAWDVRRRVRDALIEHVLAQDAEALRAAEARAQGELLAILERRLALGDVERPLVDAARGDLATARVAARAAEGRAAQSRALLAQALGVPVRALDGVTLAWPGFESPRADAASDPLEAQRAGLLGRADIRRALAAYAATEAALQLEIARQYPDVRLSPGYMFDQGENKFAIGLAVTLPAFNRNEGPIAEAEGARLESRARFLALQAAAIGEIQQARVRYRAALAELAEAEAARAAFEALERATEQAVAVGEEGRSALATVRVQRARSARVRLEALGRARTALGALEDALRQPLDPDVAVPPLPVRARDS